MPAYEAAPLAAAHYLEAAIPLPLRQTFTYRIPEHLRGSVDVGSRVVVPFGKRKLTAYVVCILRDLEQTSETEDRVIKDVIEVPDPAPLVTDDILQLTKWASEYYLASWGELIKAALPAGINIGDERFVTWNETQALTYDGPDAITREVSRAIQSKGHVRVKALRAEFGPDVDRILRQLETSGRVTFERSAAPAKVQPKRRKVVRSLPEPTSKRLDKALTPGQLRVLDAMAAAGGSMPFTELLQKALVSASVITTLSKRGWLEIDVEEVLRDPLAEVELPPMPDLTLDAAQSAALDEIGNGIESATFTAFLLHGVTGSGKTEVYIRAMRRALDLGRTAIMLVPEIALTPIFSRRLRSVFGRTVAIMHSNLSTGERFDEWRRIRDGRARVVIGTRSAVFAPVENLGVIVVDEEHDASYRQQDRPFYNARDAAVVRAKNLGATVVLGSATPALETFQNARNGKYRYLTLKGRIGGRPLAKAELIDMREVFRDAGKDVTISPQLADAVKQAHSRGEQSIILLNRRGFSRFVLCRTCGESLRCRNCEIALTYHRASQQLLCHYCGYHSKVPTQCPFCRSEFLYFIGEGTEQLEHKVERQFPGLRIARVDRDTMRRRGSIAKTLTAFDRGEIDMLVGTQMLAKGHDFHNVTLVGVISVDTALALPDFRSGERVFQLLTQVAGRAGRGELPGRVLIQTYHPEHYILAHACSQDFDGFFAEESTYRQRLGYPPFSALALIGIKHRDLGTAEQQAGIFRSALDKANSDRSCRILGPAPAPLSRLKGEYRIQIIIKGSNRSKMREVLEVAAFDAESSGCDIRNVTVEIDPINML
jgi:primosomal protein N' (replication factor Y)